MKITIHKSTSGLIKIPQNALSHIQNTILIKVLSYAFHSTDDNDHSDVHALIERMLKEHGIEPIDFMAAVVPTETNVDVSGLPKDYYKFGIKSNKDETIIIGLDNVKERSNAYFAPPNKIFICTLPLRKILYKKTMVFYRDLLNYVEELKSTVAHELTHWVQHNFLHPSNRDKKEHYDSRLPDFQLDDYLTSRIEFDPTIKSELGRFMFYLRSKGFPDGDHYDWPNIGNCLKSFVGAYSKTNPDFDFNVGQSDFFDALHRKEPKIWKKAVTIFASDVYKQVPENKRKFWHLSW